MGNRSNINLVGNTTQGQNLGSGECVFKAKGFGNIMQYKTLSVTGTTMAITSDGDNIYFSAATGGGGGLSASNNGLCDNGTTVGLGGALANNTTISAGGNSMNFCAANALFFNVHNFLNIGLSGETGYFLNNSATNYGICHETGGYSGIYVACNEFKIEDNNNSSGMSYCTDYSTIGCTCPRWIPDWAAVTGYTGGGGYWDRTGTSIIPATLSDNVRLDESSCLYWTGTTEGSISKTSTGLFSCYGTQFLWIGPSGPSWYGSKWQMSNIGGSCGVEIYPDGRINQIAPTCNIGIRANSSSTLGAGDAYICAGCHTSTGAGGNANIYAGGSNGGNGGNVNICAGCGVGGLSGGDVNICAQEGGRIILTTLPAKSSETCVVYIDASGNLSTGVGGGGTSLWTQGTGVITPTTTTNNVGVANDGCYTWDSGVFMRAYTGATNNPWCVDNGTGECIALSLSGSMIAQVSSLSITDSGFNNYISIANGGTITGKHDVKVLAAGAVDASAACDVCINGGQNSSTGLGGTVKVCGGNSTNGTGGYVCIYAGCGSGGTTNGRIQLINLPAKSSETCVTYIDASGNLSTGVGGTISGSGSAFQVPYLNAATTITSSANLRFNNRTLCVCSTDNSQASSVFGVVQQPSTAGIQPTVIVCACTIAPALRIHQLGTGELFELNSGNTTLFQIDNSGGITATGIGAASTACVLYYADSNGCITYALQSSDCRLKCCAEPISCAASLLENVCGYSVEYNDLSILSGTCEYVMMAQDVEQQLPLAVYDDVEIGEEKYKRIDYKQLVPVLWNIVKEQEARITALEAKINP